MSIFCNVFSVRTARTQRTGRNEQREALIIKRIDQQHLQQLDLFYISWVFL